MLTLLWVRWNIVMNYCNNNLNINNNNNINKTKVLLIKNLIIIPFNHISIHKYIIHPTSKRQFSLTVKNPSPFWNTREPDTTSTSDSQIRQSALEYSSSKFRLIIHFSLKHVSINVNLKSSNFQLLFKFDCGFARYEGNALKQLKTYDAPENDHVRPEHCVLIILFKNEPLSSTELQRLSYLENYIQN